MTFFFYKFELNILVWEISPRLFYNVCFKAKVWKTWSALEANQNVCVKSSYLFFLGLLPCSSLISFVIFSIWKSFVFSFISLILILYSCFFCSFVCIKGMFVRSAGRIFITGALYRGILPLQGSLEYPLSSCRFF